MPWYSCAACSDEAILNRSALIVVSGQGTLAASSAWVKAPAAGETSAMAFATITNPGMYDVFLTSATTDAAGKVEFRDTSKGADARAQVVANLTVPAYGDLSMDEKTVYLALTDLKRPLKAGDSVMLTLVTEDSTKVQVTAVVK